MSVKQVIVLVCGLVAVICGVVAWLVPAAHAPLTDVAAAAAGVALVVLALP